MGRGATAAAGNTVAIYLRVSGQGQDTASQEPDLKRWAGNQDGPVVWYRDKFTGKTMDRPGWLKLAWIPKEGKPANTIVNRIYIRYLMNVSFSLYTMLGHRLRIRLPED